jgi:predicted enzyme related to lactoylglutathione lyase
MTLEPAAFGHPETTSIFFARKLSWRGRLERPLFGARKSRAPNKENTSMSSPFVWFHHNGQKSKETKRFLETFLEWKASDGPGGLTMLAANAGPFAAVGSKEERYGDRDEWIPFVAVGDVDAATSRAVSLGATLVREKNRGLAGDFTVVRDPGGAALALWKKA